MKTFDQFVKDNTNIGIDTDGAFGNQCMDLLHAYCRDVLGLSDLSILASPNAKSVYNNFPNVKGHELFDRIANTPTGVPAKGDIVLYDWGVDGHVDIFIQGDVKSFRSFSQNWPTGSKSNVVNHPNYNGCLGWLRLKPQAPQVPMAVITQANLNIIIKARDNNWNLAEKYKNEIISNNNILTEKNDTINRLQKIIDAMKEVIKNA